ncbi:MAG: YdbL family protein [Gammaproteobacteria bacterium]
MGRKTLVRLSLAGLFLAACVTINVYFPEAAAERAADRVIDNVWGEQPPAQPRAVEPPTTGIVPKPATNLFAHAVSTALAMAVPAAHAQADFDISTPAIDALVSSMAQRFPALEPYFESGAIGLSADATIDFRDRNLVPLPERNRVRQLVADENADRNNLYREIAQANGHPEWESRVRATFAERWIARARKGWFYRNEGGEWAQK